MFEIQDHRISIIDCSAIRSQSGTVRLKEAINSIAAEGHKSLELDFRKTTCHSSAIISLVFLAVAHAREQGMEVSITASMALHRTLIISGLQSYVELRLCG